METNKQNEIRDAYEHSAQVQCIPASIKKTTEHSEEDPLMVAPYCRVSTDSKDQLASYELQCQYYKEYVSKHPGWRLYGTTLAPGRMGDESRVPKWLLVLAANRIEELKNARTKQ